MMMPEWFEPIWAQLPWDRLPHAWLMFGQKGIGKHLFAEAFARALLCENRAHLHDFACGQCAACHWMEEKTHPDFRYVAPESDDKAIDIQTIRSLIEFVQRSSHRGQARVVWLNPADALQPAAANALLKTLEEPPEQVFFILSSQSPRRLLSTLRSRCRSLHLPSPSPSQALAWVTAQGVKDSQTRLAFSGGAPFLAHTLDLAPLQAFYDVLSAPKTLFVPDVVEAFESIQPIVLLEVLQRWVVDLAYIQHHAPIRYHPQHIAMLQPLSQQVSNAALMALDRFFKTEKETIYHPLNAQLRVEHWLLQYSGAFLS